jgi:hypothetical protein
MSKSETAAAVAASIKRVASDAAATGSAPTPEFRTAMKRAGVVRLNTEPVQSVSPSHDLTSASFGKRLHRRGWCSL